MRRLMPSMALLAIVLGCSTSGRSAVVDTMQARDSTARAPSAVQVAHDAMPAAAQPPETVRRPVVLPGRPKQPAASASSRRCAIAYVNVLVRESTVANASDRTAALRSVSRRVLEPVSALVGKVDLSPAIRTFRVAVLDSAAAERVLSRVRASPLVESAERDRCETMIQR
jgi:hypothetical protein